MSLSLSISILSSSLVTGLILYGPLLSALTIASSHFPLPSSLFPASL